MAGNHDLYVSDNFEIMHERRRPTLPQVLFALSYSTHVHGPH